MRNRNSGSKTKRFIANDYGLDPQLTEEHPQKKSPSTQETSIRLHTIASKAVSPTTYPNILPNNLPRRYSTWWYLPFLCRRAGHLLQIPSRYLLQHSFFLLHLLYYSTNPIQQCGLGAPGEALSYVGWYEVSTTTKRILCCTETADCRHSVWRKWTALLFGTRAADLFLCSNNMKVIRKTFSPSKILFFS